MKISLKRIFLICACIFMIRPYYILINTQMNTIWAVITVLISTISIWQVIKYKKLKEGRWLLIYFLIMLIATFNNQQENIGSVISTFFQVILAYNIGLFWGIKRYRSAIQSVLGKIIYIYILLDIVCGILNVSSKFFNLSSAMTFLGYDNYAIYVILPMIAVKWATSILQVGKLTKEDWICWGGELIYKTIYMSVNAVLGLILFLLVYIVFKHFKKIKSLLKPQYAIVTVLILWFGVVKFNVHELFEGLFIALGKGTTLGSRTIIWEKLGAVLFDVPLIGYGMISQGFFQETIGLSSVWDLAADHAHNYIFEIWFTTGIVGLIVYLIFLWTNLKHIKRLNTPCGHILLNGVIVYFLMGFIDGYPNIATFYILIGMINSLKEEARYGY